LHVSGRSVGYTDQQREHYEQDGKIRQQAEQQELLGNFKKAIELEESLLADASRYYAEGDLCMALFRQTIAGRLNVLGRHTDAYREYELASEIFRKKLGKTHPESLFNEFYAADQYAWEYLTKGADRMSQATQTYLKMVGMQGQNPHY